MAPAVRDLELGAITGGGADGDDLEDVRLLDAYDNRGGEDASASAEGRRRLLVKVTGMTCAACSSSVESALSAVPGVARASVALLQNKADVVFDPRIASEDDIKNAIEDAGFEAEILPDFTSTKAKSQSSGTVSGQFRIGGMTCTNCVNSVESILGKLTGVKRAVVALATSSGEVEYDPALVNKDEIVEAIEDAGFEAAFLQSSEQDKVLLSLLGILSEKDGKVVEDIVGNLNGVRQFSFNWGLSEVEILFDPEVVGARDIVDAIENGSSGKLKAVVKSPFMSLNSILACCLLKMKKEDMPKKEL